MNAQDIETILNDLKADKLGRIRGKNRAINRIQALHLKTLQNMSCSASPESYSIPDRNWYLDEHFKQICNTLKCQCPQSATVGVISCKGCRMVDFLTRPIIKGLTINPTNLRRQK